MEEVITVHRDEYEYVAGFAMRHPYTMDDVQKYVRKNLDVDINTHVLYNSGAGYNGKKDFEVYFEVYRRLPGFQETTATRYNSNKPELSNIFKYIPMDSLLEEAEVWKMGAEKYGMYNWEKLWGDDTVKVVSDSLLRHLNAIIQGESHDKESGKQHAAHIRANAAMLLRYFSKDNDK